ncbi:hypothetical protein RM555_10910 [Micromonospora sp. DSM 115977]|uniref:Uncharacterized protein n=1 Tax=Micromonospora reichwaldensis TaxID=3075516 RepID=A0ABU2WUA0_9ACTN|nr:hypothetical protein [Micromonospora sp. DSM 115977]MDT0529497.1 hypothetical protein [Micromonospora sp. DSM 115977]
MIVASLLLILVAVVLLVLGLAGGSSVLLTISIAASLLAAVALVAGARQAAADRAAADPGRPGWRPRRATRPAGPAFAGGPSAEPEIPVQHVPSTVDADGTGWRQPPEPPVTDGAVPAAATPGAGPAVPYDDEPPAQDVTPGEAARVARLAAEVRVVDGRPRYHLADCAYLVGREHEPLPVAEAVDLGFTPCARCAPDTALLADAGRI